MKNATRHLYQALRQCSQTLFAPFSSSNLLKYITKALCLWRHGFLAVNFMGLSWDSQLQDRTFNFLLKTNRLSIQHPDYLLPVHCVLRMLLVSRLQQRTREIIPTPTKLIIFEFLSVISLCFKHTGSPWHFSFLPHLSNLLFVFFCVKCLLINS